MGNNVLVLANVLTLGGLEKVIVAISNELSTIMNVTLYSLKGDKFGYEYSKKLSVIFGENTIKNAVLHPILTQKAIIGKKLIQKKTLNFKIIEKNINFFQYDTLILSEADILYAPLIKKKNNNIRIIGWVHSTFDSYKDMYFKDSYKEFLEAISFVDVVVVLSETDKKSYLKIHKNVVKINNPLTIISGKIPPNKVLNKKIVSFVGRIDYQVKGLDYLIELGNYLPFGWKISVAGDGPDRLKFEKEIFTRGLESKFIIRGPLKGKKLIDHYLSSSIFILTSRHEGFGLVITEAMSLGLPVIAFDSCGPREIMGENDEYGIIIENGNIEQFSEALNSLIIDENLRNYYVQQSLKRSSDYEMKNIISQWVSILN
ncbi:glycosyltransferase [Enterococcus avium]|uniref:glycosyltransferase n=1 Tax=Enterococcus avium TaxID=33945 RepID=UPI00289280BF|nr:glycosyltransferase [Enterococcus avium]MDT2472014.1 glycosyltransferase [Enterococcus avium]